MEAAVLAALHSTAKNPPQVVMGSAPLAARPLYGRDENTVRGLTTEMTAAGTVTVAPETVARDRSRAWLPALVAVSLVVYGIALWVWFRPDFIQNWRESDTQTIARHLAEPNSSILYPRIDWGGAGPGYVETEFQLYTWIVSRFLIIFGDVEWPGQLVSLLAVVLAAWIVFIQLMRRYGQVPAAIAVA